jgi:formylglycine-generating enzyme required for sulfatase activity
MLDHWQFQELTRLVAALEELRERVKLAERAHATEEARRRWDEAIVAIAAAPEYRGLGRITPQLDLLPLSPDPESRLWEFAHLPSGTPPRRGADGRLKRHAEMGLVFVLLQGGRLPLEEGTQPTARHDREIEPFFLSKYEMTREQWSRLERASSGQAEGKGTLIPIGSVSWVDCAQLLVRLGGWLRLPSEDQWEYACRAGTTTPWLQGATAGELLEAENLLDPDKLEKDQRGTLPIGSFRASPFGLYDMHGNVTEWCQNQPDLGADPAAGDARLDAPGATRRVVRGANHLTAPERATTAYRHTLGEPAWLRVAHIGLRPARCLTR